MIQLTHDPIDYAALTESVRSPQAGATLLFLGTVREFTQGRQTVRLNYEAYPEMAMVQMQKLLDAAQSRWPIVAGAIVHRLGRLELGDISIAVAVSTPHRHQAYDAGRWLIDTLKETVPIWKEENWSDGSKEWVHPGLSQPAADTPASSAAASEKQESNAKDAVQSSESHNGAGQPRS